MWPGRGPDGSRRPSELGQLTQRTFAAMVGVAAARVRYRHHAASCPAIVR